MTKGRLLAGDRPAAADLAAEIAAPAWADVARVVKEGDRSAVLSGTARGAGVVVKCHRLRGAGDAAARLLGRTRLMRQRRAARLLSEAGIATAGVLALFEGRDEFGRTVQTLVLERIDGPTLLRCLDAGGPTTAAEHAIARAVGAQVRAVRRARLVSKDHKPSNIIVRRGAAGPEPVLIDPSVTRSAHGDGVRELVSLVLEPTGVGCPPRAALRARAFAAAVEDATRIERHVLWAAVRRGIETHGDPTPKDDPRRFGDGL